MDKDKKTVVIIGIEVLIAFILMIIAIYYGRNLRAFDVPLDGFMSEVVGATDSGNVALKAGSYTLKLEYESDKQLKGTLSSTEKRVFLHANSFNLSRNKKYVECDFYVTQDIEDLRLNISDSDEGSFSLKSVSIAENNNNFRVLVFVWIALSLLVDVCLFSSYIRDNKKLIGILMMVAFLASIPAFMYGFGLGHDTGFHLVRMEGIAEGLKAGEFPVKMNSVFDDAYGYPVDIFYPNLLLYIPAVLRVIGFSITTAYKVYIVLINIMTVVFAYVCGSKFFSDNKIAIIAAAAYTCSSYRLENLWVRQSLGEYTAMAFLPIIALAMWNIYTLGTEDKAFKAGSGLLAFGMLGLLYSHVLSTEMTAVILVVIALVYFKRTFQVKRFIALVKAVVIFALVGFAFIAPFLDYFFNTNNCIRASGEDMHYIQERGVYINDYFAFFRNVFGYDSIHSSQRMQLTPGFVLMTALLIGIFLMIMGKADKRMKMVTITSVILLFVSLSAFPWNQLVSKTTVFNMLAAIEFPWRFIGDATLFLSILLGLIVEYAAQNGFEPGKVLSAVSIGIVLVVGSFVSMYSQGIMQTYYIDTAEIPSYTGGKVSPVNGVEYLLSGTDIEILDYEIVTENGTAEIASENGVDMVLDVDMQGTGTILIPRFAYLYYDIIDDNGNVYGYESGDNNKMLIHVPGQYKGDIKVDFCIPRKWRLCELVSLVSVLAWIGILVRNRIKMLLLRGSGTK